MRIRKVKKSELRNLSKLMLEEFSKPPFNEDVSLDSVFESLMFYYKNAEIYVVDDDGISCAKVVGRFFGGCWGASLVGDLGCLGEVGE
ncbi:MAG TPA: hypothetical protein ENH20_01395 [Candidatus Pacearchaeota archaeon]|nr:hypothetical protein [Candidatus Pacearchaeota archaeon]